MIGKVTGRSLGLTLLFLFFLVSLPAQTLRSIKPLFEEHEVVLHPPLEGVWNFSGDAFAVFTKKGDNFYHTEIVSEGDTSRFECAVTRWGKRFLLHLIPVHQFRGLLSKESSIGAQLVFAAELSHDELVMIDFREEVYNTFGPGSFTRNTDGFVIISEFDQNREILMSLAQDESIFRDRYHGRRTLAPAAPVQTVFPTTSAPRVFKRIAALPSFPYRSGWLGGDGTLSVQLSDTKVLWIFSDSYVSDNPRATTRKESDTMVSNCIAISELKDGKADTSIEYYWRKDGSGHQPFFQTFTTRFRYWPQYAFLQNDTLFVLMYRVATGVNEKPGDDAFNFRTIGTTLAVVTGLQEADPLKWRIDLVPYADVLPDESLVQAAKDAQYLYVVKHENRSNYMTRVPLTSLLNPGSKIEYWSTSKTWKSGNTGDDRMILFTEQAQGSLEYYPDLKRWVYIYGPNFLTSDIRYRTAASITGPWSDGINLYKTPQCTVGSEQYHKTYFSYLARAHSAFYNARSKELVITYDTNSVDFSLVSGNDTIYVPSVLRVALRK